MNNLQIKSPAPLLSPPHLRPRKLTQFIGNFLVAVAITALFGTAFAQIVGEASTTGIWKMLVMAGSGWILFMSIAAAALPQARSSYLVGLSYTIANGALLLVPAAIAIYFIPTPLIAFIVACASVALAFGWMFQMHRLLLHRLGLSPTWLVLWVVSVLGAAASWFLLICETDFSCILR